MSKDTLPLGMIENPNHHDVRNGAKGPKGNQECCIVCGRGVEVEKAQWVCLDLRDAVLCPKDTPPSHDEWGMEPVGPECVKKHSQLLQEYLWKS